MVDADASLYTLMYTHQKSAKLAQFVVSMARF